MQGFWYQAEPIGAYQIEFRVDFQRESTLCVDICQRIILIDDFDTIRTGIEQRHQNMARHSIQILYNIFPLLRNDDAHMNPPA